MNTNPLVSILIPIYNVEKYLGKCLDSVFSQTYKNVEYVFVDDCSTDNSYDVLMSSIEQNNIPEYKYTIVSHKQNEGIAVSRADCIANAKGEYVQFVDSDDWIEPDMTETLVEATKSSQIDLVGCYFIKDFLSGKQTRHSENYSQSCAENMVLCINYDISTVLWKMLIRRSLFSYFKITPHVDIVEDYIISVKLYFYANSFAVVDKYMYHYVQYNEGRVSFQTLRSITNHIKGVKEVEEFLADYPCNIITNCSVGQLTSMLNMGQLSYLIENDTMNRSRVNSRYCMSFDEFNSLLRRGLKPRNL